DALSRLKKVTGGSTATWNQTYSYDRYGNRKTIVKTGAVAQADLPKAPATLVLAEIAALTKPPTLDSLFNYNSERDERPPFLLPPAKNTKGANVTAAPAAAPFVDYNGFHVSNTVPTTLTANGVMSYTITMRNSGDKAWLQAIFNGDGNVQLCSESFSSNMGGWKPFGALMPDFVFHQPGTNVTFKNSNLAPVRAGTYFARWQLCRQPPGSQMLFFGTPTPLITINVLPSLQFDALYVSQSVPTTMNLGETQTLSFTFKNLGTQTWTAGSVWLQDISTGSSLVQEGTRIQLPRNLRPNAQITKELPVNAPFQPATHTTPRILFLGP